MIIAEERARRPSDFIHAPVEPRRLGKCSFCAGNEADTPGEILAYRNGSAPNGPGWSLRVVPNKFPALRVEGDLNREGLGIFD